MSVPPRVIVAGFLARFPLGGYAWQALHYLVGFQRLGCDVFFYEDSAFYADAYNPEAGAMEAKYDYGLARLSRVLGGFGFGERWAFWDAGRDLHHGRSRAETERVFERADLLVNVGGVNRFRDRRVPEARIYVDVDPAFTQINLVENRSRPLRELLSEHTLHFTFGENIGTARSPLPTGEVAWRPTRPPVVADLWESPHGAEGGGAFTTIGKWESTHRDVTFRGERYGWRKSEEWRKFLELPSRTGERFEVAMDVHNVPPDEKRLRCHGWAVRDPLDVSIDHERYRAYIQASRGEFSAAKDMNVRLRSGWFSDRTVCYLAAGRPAVLQDTGFSDVLPCGRGLHSVGSIDEAVEAFARIRADYAAESRRAAEIARECFGPPSVLGPMLEAAGL